MSSKNRDSRSDALVVMAESGMPPSAATSPTVSGAAPVISSPSSPVWAASICRAASRPRSSAAWLVLTSTVPPERARSSSRVQSRAQPAVGDDHDVVDGLLDLREVVAGDEHGAAASGVVAQEVAQPADALRVEPVGGLVENEDLRVAEQRGGQAEPLAHAERVAADPAVRPRRSSPTVASTSATRPRPMPAAGAVTRRWFRAERQGWKVFASSTRADGVRGIARGRA